METKSFEEGLPLAQSLMGWDLLIIGGTILLLLGSSYYRPGRLAIRLCYLLFLPGWACLGLSMYHGVQQSRLYLTVYFARNPDIGTLKGVFVSEAYKQIWWMYLGLLFFAAWLTVFLLYWVFAREIVADKDGGKEK